MINFKKIQNTIQLKKLNKYINNDLIKSDTGDNLVTYWTNVYNVDHLYTDSRLKEIFSRKLESLVIIEKMLNTMLTGVLYSVTMNKCEICLTHCLVLNNIMNERKHKDINDAFEDVMSDFRKINNFNAVYNKVKKDLDEK